MQKKYFFWFLIIVIMVLQWKWVVFAKGEESLLQRLLPNVITEEWRISSLIGTDENNKLEENFIPAIINFMIGSVGLIALIVMLYAGIMMVTSFGDEEKRENAKKALYWGMTGIVFVFLAYIIVIGITSLQFNNP